MKLDLTETHADKKYLQTKADPSKALNEAQPGEPFKNNPQRKVRFANNAVSASVALEESNLGDLRSMVHKDAAGNIISEFRFVQLVTSPVGVDLPFPSRS